MIRAAFQPDYVTVIVYGAHGSIIHITLQTNCPLNIWTQALCLYDMKI